MQTTKRHLRRKLIAAGIGSLVAIAGCQVPTETIHKPTSQQSRTGYNQSDKPDLRLEFQDFLKAAKAHYQLLHPFEVLQEAPTEAYFYLDFENPPQTFVTSGVTWVLEAEDRSEDGTVILWYYAQNNPQTKRVIRRSPDGTVCYSHTSLYLDPPIAECYNPSTSSPSPIPSPEPSVGPLRERIKDFLENDLKPIATAIDPKSVDELNESAIFAEMFKLSREGYNNQDIVSEFESVAASYSGLIVGGSSNRDLGNATDAFSRLFRFITGPQIPVNEALPQEIPYDYAKSQDRRYDRVITIYAQLYKGAVIGLDKVNHQDRTTRKEPYQYGREIFYPKDLTDSSKPTTGVTPAEADLIGSWFTETIGGGLPLSAKMWISLDQWRRYRFGTLKDVNTKNPRFQANYEIARKQREFGNGPEAPISATNGHLNVAR